MSNITKDILIMSIGTGLGGIEKSMIEFLRFLVTKENLNIDLYLWRSPGALYNQIPTNINVINCCISPHGIRECRNARDFMNYICFRVLNLFSIGTKTFKKIEKRYDLAIAYCQVGHTSHYIIDKVTAKKKFLFFHHGSYESNRVNFLIDKTYFKAYDGIIAMSKASAEMLKKKFPECENKIYSCSPLFNPESIKEQSKQFEVAQYDAENPTFVTVARLSQEKGIQKALETAKILKENGLKFMWLFIGGGAEKNTYSKYIAENGLEDFCILLGPKDNPYPYISKATIYVQPSNVESYCITIREAAVFNIPIIVSKIPALCEATSEINNLQITNNNPQCLADKISRILADEAGMQRGDYKTAFKFIPNEYSVKFLSKILLNDVD